MNPFEVPEKQPTYELRVDQLAGAYYVEVKQLLDILANRAMLSLRASGAPGTETRIADFERGRFAELQELYKALEIHVHK